MDALKRLWRCRASDETEVLSPTSKFDAGGGGKKATKSVSPPLKLATKTITGGGPTKATSKRHQQHVKTTKKNHSRRMQETTSTSSTMTTGAAATAKDEDLQAITAWRRQTQMLPLDNNNDQEEADPPTSLRCIGGGGGAVVMKRTASTRASPHFTSYREQIEQSFRPPYQEPPHNHVDVVVDDSSWHDESVMGPSSPAVEVVNHNNHHHHAAAHVASSVAMTPTLSTASTKKKMNGAIQQRQRDPQQPPPPPPPSGNNLNKQQHRADWKTKSEEYLKALNCVAASASPASSALPKFIMGDEWGNTRPITTTREPMQDETTSFLSSVMMSGTEDDNDTLLHFPTTTTMAGRPMLRRTISETSSNISRPDTDDGDSQPDWPRKTRTHHQRSSSSTSRTTRSSSRSRQSGGTSSRPQRDDSGGGVLRQHDYQAPGAQRRDIDPSYNNNGGHRGKQQQQQQQSQRSASLSRLRPSHRDSPSVHSPTQQQPQQRRRSLSRGNNTSGRRSSSQRSNTSTTATTPTTTTTIGQRVDESVTQQYETACRLLKSAILEKNLDEAERNFLANILSETTKQGLAPLTPRGSTTSASSSKTKKQKGTATTPTGSPPQQQQPHPNDISQLTSPTILSGFPFCRPASYGSNNNGPTASHCNFKILGCDLNKPVVFSPMIMEALQGFLTSSSTNAQPQQPVPDAITTTATTTTAPQQPAQQNYWLKYSTARDPVSMADLLESVRATRLTIFCIETTDGDVFGAVVSTKWRVKSRWYGGSTNKDAFLWRLKKARPSVNGSGEEDDDDDDFDEDNELEIYPNTNVDAMVQYCTEKALAFGGGTDWTRLRDGCPYGPDEPQGIGLLIDGDLMGGESNSCVTFANPSLCQRSHHAAVNEFDVKTLEVWTTTPCSTVLEAERHEMGRGGANESTAVVERSNNIFACVRPL